ncbi:MAG: hypothetical protein M3P30_04735 [Chloroflexota bacterium]|nr:hypothetical protein [Chloroflexota bacterium]
MIETYRITAQLVADLAWPLVVLLVSAVILNQFPIEIRGLLRRVLGFKTPLVSADFGPPVQLESSSPTEEPGVSAAVVTSVIAVASQAQVDLAQAQQAVGVWWNYWRHEISYRRIFGTQMDVLRFLNGRPDGVGVDELDPLYQRHLGLVRLSYPAYSYTREAYLNFLVGEELATATLDRFAITPRGTDFLSYLVTMKLPDKWY